MSGVGVIGLGNMGAAFAERLLARGVPVAGFDIVPAACDALAAGGGRAMESAADVARESDPVVLSLPSAVALDVALADVISGAREGQVLVELSTLPVDVKERARAALARRGAILLDGAASGTPASVRAGEVALLVSGDQAAFEQAAPMLAAFARSARYVGAFGQATRLKLICNLLVVIHDAATAEAMSLAVGAGIDKQLAYDVVCDGIGSSRIWEQRGKMMVDGDYRPGSATFRLAVKDGALIDELARETGSFAPMFQLGRQLHAAALGHGLGDLDAAALLELYRSLSTSEET